MLAGGAAPGDGGFDPPRSRTYDESRRPVFDKLRKLFGGGSGDPDPDLSSPVTKPRAAGSTVRRPARPRQGRSASGKPTASTRPRAASSMAAAVGPPAPETPPPAEVACPNCGEPMLAGWGTTCGKCRPNLVSPKTMFLAAGQVALPAQAPGGMTLGWLVVVRSVDEKQRGALIELDQQRVVLSRAGAGPAGASRVVEFDDTFMSSGHAVLSRPDSGDRTDAFTIRDRDNPSPSVNGTFVNSHKLTPGEVVRLADGDVVKLGATEMLFKSLWLSPVGARP
ncbi:MAG: Inner rane component of cytoplasmic domain [Myxococcales bacterium]|nr:Inner rane component of cytoplasmic domain [Myxococcales bacterium]